MWLFLPYFLLCSGHLVNFPFNGKATFHIERTFTVRASQVRTVVAYYRIVGTRTSFTCNFLYTGLKVVIADWMLDWPETPIHCAMI